MKKGKFITLLGINNIGKSTQVRLLINKIWETSNGQLSFSMKYPFYEVEPIGPMLNDYWHCENPFNLSSREFQTLQAFHRLQIESQITSTLEHNIHVVAEDYIGTGIACGLGSEVNEEYLLKINSGLLVEDLTILLDGDRFLEVKENNHTNESNDELTEKVRHTHLKLAEDYGWSVVNANNTPEVVHANVWKIVQPMLAS